MTGLSTRGLATLRELAHLHQRNQAATYRPDLLSGLACGTLTRAGLAERLSSTPPKAYRITRAGLAWLAEHDRRASAPDPPASATSSDVRQLDLFGGES